MFVISILISLVPLLTLGVFGITIVQVELEEYKKGKSEKHN